MAKARPTSDTDERGFSPAFAPKGLSRVDAARHIGVSASMFDEMVRDGRMPQPKLINARVLWDRMKVEAFFDILPERGVSNAETDGWEDWK